MPKKVVSCEIEGQTLEAVNTWFGGLRLNLNGEKVGSFKPKIAPKKGVPAITAMVDLLGGRSSRVEVFAKATTYVQLKIHVDGVHVAGDAF